MKRKLAFLSQILIAFLLALPPQPERTVVEPPTAQLTSWVDPFDASELNARWTWKYENPDGWSLSARPGYLQMTPVGRLNNTENNLQNLLYTAAPSDDFQVTASLEFTTTADGQGAGLVLYLDDDSYVELSLERWGGEPFLHLRKESGSFTIIQFPQLLHETRVYLRLAVERGFASGYYSLDQQEWIYIGQAALDSLAMSIGLQAFTDQTGPGESPAYFDQVEVGAVPTPDIVWEHQGLYGAFTGGPFDRIAFDTETGDLYGCVRGVYGLYRLPYGAQAWLPVQSSGGGCSGLSIDNQDHIIYWSNGWSVMRSADDGGRWQTIYLSPSPVGVTDIEVSAAAAHTVFVGLASGEVLRSADAGITWQAAQFSLDGSNWVDQVDCALGGVESDPTSPDRVFMVASGGPNLACAHSGVYRSLDGGAKFTRVLSDTLLLGSSLAVSANGTVFATLNGHLNRSLNHGSDWTILDIGIPVLYSPITFHPSYPNTVFVSFGRSDDNGDTWTGLSTGYILPIIDPSHTNRWVYTTMYGFRLSLDSGETVQEFNAGLQEIQVTRVAIDPTNPQHMFVCANNELVRSKDGGQTWDYPLGFSGGHDVMIDPTDPQIVYSLDSGGSGFNKSLDGGDTWQYYPVADTSYEYDLPQALALDPGDNQTAYLAMVGYGPPWSKTLGGVYKTIDAGETWTVTAMTNMPVQTVAFDADGQTLYTGLATVNDANRPALYYSRDGGDHWTAFDALKGWPVTAIVADPRYAGHVYVGTQNGLWKTEDSGATWNLALDGGAVNRIAIYPDLPDVVYALVAGAYIYRSLDAGGQWTLIYIARPSDGSPSELHFQELQALAGRQGVRAEPGAPQLFMGNTRGLFITRVTFTRVFLPLILR